VEKHSNEIAAEEPRMLTAEFVQEFAAAWFQAWNAHDLPAVLAHYTEDFEMSSPYIVQIAGEPSGKLKGKQNVGSYWKKGLERFPELRFHPIAVLGGVDTITLHYRGANGRLSAEVFFFNAQGQVEKSFAHYAV
jgi:SnoaL-like domain